MRGNVLAYQVTKDGEETDSCYGFFDEESEVIKEAKDVVDHQIRRTVKTHLQRLKAWIINKVSLEYRTPAIG